MDGSAEAESAYGVFDAANKAFASIDNTRLEKNGDAFGAFADAGVAGQNWSDVTIRHSVATGNYRGFSASSFAPADVARVVIENSEASFNVIGLHSLGSSTMRVSGTIVAHNTSAAIQAQGTSMITSRGNNTVSDNAGGETFSGPFAAK
jgi:hypothetical protein